jgi:hypothetical protein
VGLALINGYMDSFTDLGDKNNNGFVLQYDQDKLDSQRLIETEKLEQNVENGNNAFSDRLLKNIEEKGSQLDPPTS